jgi:hypothetical protein
MRRLLAPLAALGVAVGAALLLRRRFANPVGPAPGSVEIVLEDGTTVEPGAEEAREFVDIAGRVLEVSGR